jgi:hypothetical protein
VWCSASGAGTYCFTGTVQTGTSNTVVVLPSGASAIDSFYNNWWIKITSWTTNTPLDKLLSHKPVQQTATLSSAFYIYTIC